MMLLLAILLACDGDTVLPHGYSAAPSLALTRWTGGHELLMKMDAPVAGRALRYQAYVTRMADNHAVSSGTMVLRFEQDGFVVESHTDDTVDQRGVFAAQAPAPQTAGVYRLVVSYTNGETRVEWDLGVVDVGDGAPKALELSAEGEIAFRKEAQWQIPFQVGQAEERLMAPTVIAAGVAEPAPGSTAVVAAPVAGLVAWADALPVTGRAVSRGERLATLVPAGAAAYWAGLQAALSTARVERDLAAADLERVRGLVDEALLPERRQLEADAALERAEAELHAARQRVAALTSGTAGAVSIRAPANGVIVAVGAEHGVLVEAGAPLVKVADGPGLLLRAHAHEQVIVALSPVESLAVMRGGWDAPRDLLAVGGQLLTEQLITDPRTLSAPVDVLVESPVGLRPGDLIEVQIGVGQPEPTLAVPRSAVVEVNGQNVVFVQVSGESFSRRAVVLGDGDASHVEIRAGLASGERVVVEGGFDVHVASLSGTLESHRH